MTYKIERPDGTYLDLRSTKPLTRKQIRELEPGTNIIVQTNDGCSSLFACYRPPRHRNESPVQYYKRTDGVVDNRFKHKHNGYYYCNPAHCKRRWKSKEARDEHLTGAYGIL